MSKIAYHNMKMYGLIRFPGGRTVCLQGDDLATIEAKLDLCSTDEQQQAVLDQYEGVAE